MIYIRGIIKDIKLDTDIYPTKYVLIVSKDKETMEVRGGGECPFIIGEVITIKVSSHLFNNKLYYDIEDSVNPEFITETDKKYNIVNPGIYSIRDWRLFHHSSSQALQVMLSGKDTTLTNMGDTYISLTKDFIRWNQELIK